MRVARRSAALLLLLVAGCAAPRELRPEPRFFAYGSDPGWTLTIARGRIRLAAAPNLTVDAPAVPPALVGSTLRYRVAGIVIDVERRTCRDRRSGLAFSDTVRVAVDRTILDGCGGRRLPLLDT